MQAAGERHTHTSLFTHSQAQWDFGANLKIQLSPGSRAHKSSVSFVSPPPCRIRGQRAGSHAEERLQSGDRKDFSVENLRLLRALFHLSMGHIHRRGGAECTLKTGFLSVC